MTGAELAQPSLIRPAIDDPLILPLVPAGLRARAALLWSIDRRLAELSRSGREPALRQIRLAWWIERLRALRDGPPPPEPLLARAHAELIAHIAPISLAKLGEAWEAEATGEADEGDRGAILFGMTAQLIGGSADDDAGRLWAGVERALASEGEGDWEGLRLLARRRRTPMPRALTALTALVAGIARREGRRSRWREQADVLRAGLLG